MRRLVIPSVVGSLGLALAVMAPGTGYAGSLCIYEASVGCGNVRHVPSPAIGVVLDIDYDPGTVGLLSARYFDALFNDQHIAGFIPLASSPSRLRWCC